MRRSIGLAIAICLAGCARGSTGEPAPARSGVQRGEQIDGRRLPVRALSLTYDDGPDERTLDLARYLAGEGIPATFFVNGCRLEGSPPSLVAGVCEGPRQDPAILAELVALGHRVANHTLDHVSLAGISRTDFLYELIENQVQLDPFIDDGLRLFRPPANYWDGALADFMSDPDAPAIARRIVGPIFRDVDGADWGCAKEGLTPAACADRYLAALDARPERNGIVQMHDRNEFARGTDYALEVTRVFVEALRRRPERYTFVPLDAIPGVLSEHAFGVPSAWSDAFSDAAGWAEQASRYASMQLGDVDGDGDADLCGRDAGGVVCALSDGRAFAAPTRWLSADFRDDSGWAPARHGATLRLGDIDGDGAADVCGRGGAGLVCYRSDGERTFSAGIARSPAFSDADGWGAHESYYASITLGDIDGDRRADACGRAPTGIVCVRSAGDRFEAPEAWLTTDFTDAAGWREERHGTTIRLADVDGDGRADVCGRGTFGVVCGLVDPPGRAFTTPTVWSVLGAFSDRAGWDARSHFASLGFGDVDGDGRADACGRDDSGVVCALSDGRRFTRARYVWNEDFRRDTGWEPDAHSATLRLGDVDGDGAADICARGGSVALCMLAPDR
jgi:peptidoglycan/xylan/chitin deacetylase (PgdA/CDA1 family)